MIRPSHFAIVAAAVAVLFFGTGCSTVSSRIKERPQAFQQLSAADQALAKSGKIRNGSGKDAVYLAWGKADAITTGESQGKPAETWTYFGYEQQTVSHYDVIPRVVARGQFVPDIVYNPYYISHRYIARQVTFQNEKVVAWTEGQFR